MKIRTFISLVLILSLGGSVFAEATLHSGEKPPTSGGGGTSTDEKTPQQQEMEANVKAATDAIASAINATAGAASAAVDSVVSAISGLLSSAKVDESTTKSVSEALEGGQNYTLGDQNKLRQEFEKAGMPPEEIDKAIQAVEQGIVYTREQAANGVETKKKNPTSGIQAAGNSTEQPTNVVTINRTSKNRSPAKAYSNGKNPENVRSAATPEIASITPPAMRTVEPGASKTISGSTDKVDIFSPDFFSKNSSSELKAGTFELSQSSRSEGSFSGEVKDPIYASTPTGADSSRFEFDRKTDTQFAPNTQDEEIKGATKDFRGEIPTPGIIQVAMGLNDVDHEGAADFEREGAEGSKFIQRFRAQLGIVAKPSAGRGPGSTKPTGVAKADSKGEVSPVVNLGSGLEGWMKITELASKGKGPASTAPTAVDDSTASLGFIAASVGQVPSLNQPLGFAAASKTKAKLALRPSRGFKSKTTVLPKY